MTGIQDGVVFDCFCDCARCELVNKNPEKMDECPLGKDYCTGECQYYTEDWEVQV